MEFRTILCTHATFWFLGCMLHVCLIFLCCVAMCLSLLPPCAYHRPALYLPATHSTLCLCHKLAACPCPYLPLLPFLYACTHHTPLHTHICMHCALTPCLVGWAVGGDCWLAGPVTVTVFLLLMPACLLSYGDILRGEPGDRTGTGWAIIPVSPSLILSLMPTSMITTCHHHYPISLHSHYHHLLMPFSLPFLYRSVRPWRPAACLLCSLPGGRLDLCMHVPLYSFFSPQHGLGRMQNIMEWDSGTRQGQERTGLEEGLLCSAHLACMGRTGTGGMGILGVWRATQACNTLLPEQWLPHAVPAGTESLP